jgi:hypothetical protein
MDAPLSKNGFEAFDAKVGMQGYGCIGKVKCSGRLVNDDELRKFASSVGGDLVAKATVFAGMRSGSRYVVDSYTPGRVITSLSNMTGTVSNSSSGSIYGQNGSAYWNGGNSANIYGTGSSTTFVPGETSYVRENFQYPAYLQIYMIYQSDPVFRRNANNFRKFMKEVKNVTMTDAQFAQFVDGLTAAKLASQKSKKQ